VGAHGWRNRRVLPGAGCRVSAPARQNGAAWFDDATVVASLPPHLRAYAAYSRLAVNRRSGRVVGGSFVLRWLHRLTPALHLPREARARVAERTVYLDLTDARFLWVLDEVRGLGSEHRVMQLLLRAGDTFLDVGANHGSFAILASHLVGPSGRVVAVEPQPRLADLVRRSLAEAPAPFDVHAVALGEYHGEAALHVPTAGSGAASVVARPRTPARTLTVPLRRGDDLLAWRLFPGRLMIKLDVEGSEPAFLEGARGMIEARRPVLLFELSAQQARAAGHTPEALLAKLRALGYTQFAEVDRYPEATDGVEHDLERQRNLVAWHG
jgi:FkbM family methyltransferase